MTLIFSTVGSKVLSGVTFSGGEGQPGSTLSWTGLSSGATEDSASSIRDIDEDGKLDVGTDYFGGVSTLTYSGYTITSGGVEYPVFAFPGGPYVVALPQQGSTQTLIGSTGTSNAFQNEPNSYMCFAAGTQIATPSGEAPVESLAAGDEIRCADGRIALVKWIGRQSVLSRIASQKLQPVRIRAGALGQTIPHSDLTVTADHGMIVDGLVINASALVNGATIDFVPLSELPPRVTYYHIETEGHDVILANGAATETFVDAVGRAAFDNYAEYLDLYGAERIILEMDRPRISSHRMVPAAIRARLGGADDRMDYVFPLMA